MAKKDPLTLRNNYLNGYSYMALRLIYLLLFLPVLINCQHEKKIESSTLLIRSIDFGRTWQDISIGLPSGWEATYIYAGNDEIIVGSERDLFRKRLANESGGWDKEYVIQDHLGGVLPGKKGVYIYDFWTGLLQEGLRGTGIWEPQYKGVSNGIVRTVLEVSDKQVLIGGDSGIYKSEDGGASWRPVFDSTLITHILIKEGVLIAGGSSGVLRSLDGGEHWTWVLKDLGPVRKLKIMGDQLAVVMNGVGSWEEQLKGSSGSANSLLFSDDLGGSWRSMEGGLLADRLLYDPEKEVKAKFIHDIIQTEQYLWCSHDTGISRSAGGGKTWELILPIEYGQLYGFAYHNNVIYVTKVGVLGGC